MCVLSQENSVIPLKDPIAVKLKQISGTHVKVLVSTDRLLVVIHGAHQGSMLDVQVFEFKAVFLSP